MLWLSRAWCRGSGSGLSSRSLWQLLVPSCICSTPPGWMASLERALGRGSPGSGLHVRLRLNKSELVKFESWNKFCCFALDRWLAHDQITRSITRQTVAFFEPRIRGSCRTEPHGKIVDGSGFTSCDPGSPCLHSLDGSIIPAYPPEQVSLVTLCRVAWENWETRAIA